MCSFDVSLKLLISFAISNIIGHEQSSQNICMHVQTCTRPVERGRMPDSQSNRLCYSFEDWASSFSPRRPSSLSRINEYLAIDGGGNASEQSLHVIAAWLECFPEKPNWCRNEQVSQG